MKLHLYYVYINTNSYHNVLYTGVTNNLKRRCYEHKQKIVKGFTQKYNVDRLVCFEKFDSIGYRKGKTNQGIFTGKEN